MNDKKIHKENNAKKRGYFTCKHIKEKNMFDKDANKKTQHYHNHYEFFYFIGDQMIYFINNRPIKLVKHDIVLITPQMYHRSMYYNDFNQERIVISFALDFFDIINNETLAKKIQTIFSRNWIHIIDVQMKVRIHNAILNIVRSYYAGHDTGLLRSRLLFSEILLYMTEVYDALPDENSRELLISIEKNIHDIVNYINREYMHKITLDEIAQRFFISKYYLCRAFKKIIGMSVVEFINEKRISETANQLQNTKRPISEISVSVGFNSQAFFIKLFKKTYGMTPSAYRKYYR